MILRRIFITVAAMALLACYDSDFSMAAATAEIPAATTTLAELRDSFKGESLVVEGDIVIEGRVTSDDRARNFYRTLTIEDDGAAIELMAGADHLSNSYPEGCRVSLRLKGLTLARSRSLLQAGYAPEPGSGYATAYIPSRVALECHLTLHPTPSTHNIPTPCTIAELTPQMCCCLVRIEALTLQPDTEELLAPTWAGERVFTDRHGNTLQTFVRDYARFADNEIPKSEGSITGILYLSGENYQLKPRYEQDLEF